MTKEQEYGRRVIVGAMLVGFALRLFLFLKNPSPWFDEQQLAVNIARRSFVQLGHELDFAQSAPLLFLWSVRLVVLLTGVTEESLRAVPLVAGILLMPAIWLLARRLFTPSTGLFALVFVTVSPVFLRYSNEIKPYGLDALVAIGIVWLALDCLDHASQSRRWVRLAAVGALSVWVSTTAIFSLTGIGLALLVAREVRAHRRALLALVLCGTIWIVSFVCAYVAVYRAGAANGYMQRFWADSFLSISPIAGVPQLFEIVGGLISATFLHRDLFGGPLSSLRPVFVGIFAAIFVIGVRQAERKLRLPPLVMIVSPFIIALAASAARLYPLSVRLMLFAAPSLVILTGAGLERLLMLRTYRHPLRWYAIITTILLLPAFVHVVVETRDPDRKELARSVIERLRSYPISPATPVYVFSSSIAAWLLYTTDWAAPDSERVDWVTRLARQPGGPISYNAPPRAQPVVREGDQYTRQYSGRTEVYGTPSGVVETATYIGTTLDRGWAENESRRIRDIARPCAWLVAVHHHEVELTSIFDSLRRAGIRSTVIQQGAGAALVLSCTERAQ